MTQNLFANFHTEMGKEVKVVNNLPASASVREAGLICGLERSPGKGKIATHSSILAWRILWTEDPWGFKELDTTEALHFSFIPKWEEPGIQRLHSIVDAYVFWCQIT